MCRGEFRRFGAGEGRGVQTKTTMDNVPQRIAIEMTHSLINQLSKARTPANMSSDITEEVPLAVGPEPIPQSGATEKQSRVEAALDFALEAALATQPPDSVRFVAQKLRVCAPCCRPLLPRHTAAASPYPTVLPSRNGKSSRMPWPSAYLRVPYDTASHDTV